MLRRVPAAVREGLSTFMPPPDADSAPDFLLRPFRDGTHVNSPPVARHDPPGEGRVRSVLQSRNGEDEGTTALSRNHLRIRRDLIRARSAPRPFALVLLVLVVAVAIGVLLVTWKSVEDRLFPAPDEGMEYLLLTLRTVVIAGIACGIVYADSRRRRRAVEGTADRLAGLLEVYMADPVASGSFESRGLRHGRGGRETDPAAPVVPGATVDPRAMGDGLDDMMSLLRDESRQTEQLRARIVEREKVFSLGQLASGIAHEVGNPLSSISSVLQVLQRGGVDEKTAKQFTVIESHIERIHATVRQLAKLARRDDARWALVDVGRALEEAVQLASFDERSKGVEMVYEPSADLPCLRAIPGELDQVLLNLLLNALDAMPGGGTLTVRARRAGKSLLLKIRDTGVGIPPDVGQRVFQPYFTTKDPGRGTGMGLAVSYAIIRRLGGTIEYDSTVGKGTVFTVILPVQG